MGHKRKVHNHETFAEIVEGVTAANPDTTKSRFDPIYSPINEGEYTDKYGVRWQLRGGELRWARIQHLILDHRVAVLHAYDGELHEIADDDRADFLSAVRPYLKGVHIPPPGDYTDYIAAEFKDDQHRSLLVIEEFC